MRFVPFRVLIMLTSCAAPAAGAPDGDPPGTGWTPDQNVLGYVEQSDQLTRLLSLLKLAGMTETLKAPGPVTLLAPTDDAFAGMPPAMLRDLQLPRNKPQLVRILGCHVIAQRVILDGLLQAASAKGPVPLQTVGGCRLTVHAAGDRLTIDDENGIKAAVIFSDVKEANGVVQVVDGVLTPGIKDPKAGRPD